MKTQGICKFCNKLFSGSSVHLKSCKERMKSNEAEEKSEKIYLIKAGIGPYWVYFEIKASSSLSEVDSFLRELWLECCGHLSAFNINGATYTYEPQEEFDDKSMNVPLSKVISPNTFFTYEYDFGTTTGLNLKCISERIGKIKDISIVAKNNAPEIKCKCENPATDVCSQCIWEDNGFMCKSCAKKHECGEEMLLPVVNSPRMGMCGYTGND